jgi:hypothetical protein
MSIINSTAIPCSIFFSFFFCVSACSLPVHLHYHHLKTKVPNIIVYEQIKEGFYTDKKKDLIPKIKYNNRYGRIVLLIVKYQP